MLHHNYINVTPKYFNKQSSYYIYHPALFWTKIVKKLEPKFYSFINFTRLF